MITLHRIIVWLFVVAMLFLTFAMIVTVKPHVHHHAGLWPLCHRSGEGRKVCAT